MCCKTGAIPPKDNEMNELCIGGCVRVGCGYVPRVKQTWEETK